jgi:hypothetical protein
MMQVPWCGVMTNHSTSPFAEEMYEKIRDALIQYEVIINRWPQYSLILENVSSTPSPQKKKKKPIFVCFYALLHTHNILASAETLQLLL